MTVTVYGAGTNGATGVKRQELALSTPAGVNSLVLADYFVDEQRACFPQQITHLEPYPWFSGKNGERVYKLCVALAACRNNDRQVRFFVEAALDTYHYD